MPLTLSWGSVAEARAAGIEDMLALHWEEVEIEHERVPLAINWDAYRRLERDGVLKTLLLRDDAKLIGYSVFYVQPVLHHSLTQWAVADLIYVDPEHRKGWAGVQLIRQGEQYLRELGVKVIHYSVKPTVGPGDLGYKRGRDSVGTLLQKLGYRRVEEAWAKYL